MGIHRCSNCGLPTFTLEGVCVGCKASIDRANHDSAIRNAALDEAAALCRARFADHPKHSPMKVAAETCAKAIEAKQEGR
jgi:predicted amidophosphoribosyltransferase